MKVLKTYLIVLLLFSSIGVFSQHLFLLDKLSNISNESDQLLHVDSFHSCIYPHIGVDSLAQYPLVAEKNSFLNLLMNKKMIKLPFLSTHIYPVFNTEATYDWNKNPSPHSWSTGLALTADWHQKILLNISTWGAVQTYNQYQQMWIDSLGILPNKGGYNNRTNYGYTYFDYRASILYMPSSYILFQLGKDKNFWGDGYRSLILSDNATSYPFLKIVVTAWKIKYIMLYQFLEDVNLYNNYALEKKYIASHFLSWNIGKRFNINMFESVIFKNSMKNGSARGFDINYLNPIVFFRPIEYSIGSPDNVIMGSGFRYRFFKNTHLYGQFVLDEFKLSEWIDNKDWWANKVGYQLGVKMYNFFNIPSLFARIEYNTVRPFTYSHRDAMGNYGYLSRPLAHPYGANFKEWIFNISYQTNRWFYSTKISFAQVGMDKDGLDYGQNIYRSYLEADHLYGNTLLQGDLTRIDDCTCKVRYLLNPEWNLSVEGGVHYFIMRNTVSDWNSSLLFLSLKTLF